MLRAKFYFRQHDGSQIFSSNKIIENRQVDKKNWRTLKMFRNIDLIKWLTLNHVKEIT